MDTSLFDLLRDDIRDGFKGTHERLDKLNGRVRETEQDIAVLQDRATQQEATAKNDPTARLAGALGGLLAALGTLWHYFSDK